MAVYTAIDFGGGGSLNFTDVNTNITMVANNGYDVLVNSILSMPIISARDDVIQVTNFDATGFTIQCNAGETIFGLNANTSSGGSIVATTPGTTLYLVCLIARTEWQILTSIGELQFN
jgi:hypothetical protein